jgi:hypothetical protein
MNFVADHLSWNSNKARLGCLLCLSDCSELERSVIHKSLINPNVRDWWNRSLSDTSQGMFWIKKDRLNSLSVRTFESQYWIRTDRSQLINYNATLLAATLLAMSIVDKFAFQHYSILAYRSGVLSTCNLLMNQLEFLQQGEFPKFFWFKTIWFHIKTNEKGILFIFTQEIFRGPFCLKF